MIDTKHLYRIEIEGPGFTLDMDGNPPVIHTGGLSQHTILLTGEQVDFLKRYVRQVDHTVTVVKEWEPIPRMVMPVRHTECYSCLFSNADTPNGCYILDKVSFEVPDSLSGKVDADLQKCPEGVTYDT